MKNNLTELVYIIDRSGSMSYLVKDTIGGYNTMINDQKSQPGEAKVTTVLFNHNYKKIEDRTDIQSVAEMTEDDYHTWGSTSMLDAIGATIDDIGAKLRDTPEEERPCKVIVTIITDGEENSSKEYTREHVKEMIEHQKKVYSWLFIFVGANIDAIENGTSIGIDAQLARNYTASARGTEILYKSISTAISTSRGVDGSVTVDTLNFMSDALDKIE